MKRSLGLALIFALTTFLFAGAGEKKLIVQIGKSASEAKAAFSHTMTIAKLEKGETEYTVNATADHGHRITLSESQIKDILEGTTVHVEAGGHFVVQITAKSLKPKKSGW